MGEWSAGHSLATPDEPRFGELYTCLPHVVSRCRNIPVVSGYPSYGSMQIFFLPTVICVFEPVDRTGQKYLSVRPEIVWIVK